MHEQFDINYAIKLALLLTSFCLGITIATLVKLVKLVAVQPTPCKITLYAEASKERPISRANHF